MAKEDINVEQVNKMTQSIVDRAFSQPPDRGLAINIVNFQFSNIKQDKKSLELEKEKKTTALQIEHKKEDISLTEYIQILISQKTTLATFQRRMRQLYVAEMIAQSESVAVTAEKLDVSPAYVRKIRSETK